MDKFTTHTGTAVPLRRSNVDTDQIIPAVYLKRVTRTGFEDGLFSAWREDPAFVLNDPAYAGASILVAGPEFGTGSSREHAVWALRDWGFRAVISPRFGDIFRGNALKEGLLPVELELKAVEALWDLVEADPTTPVTVDLAAREVARGRRHLGLPARRLQPLAAAGRPRRHRTDAAPRGPRSPPTRARRPPFLPVGGIGRTPDPHSAISPPSGPTGGGESVTTQGFFSRRCLCPDDRGHTVRAEWLALSPVAHVREEVVNKAELIEALAARLGDRKTATAALDAVLAEVQSAVTKGDRVAITGFGVFEKRVRGARTARNPRTGEAVKVKKTSVPAFRAGAGFKEMVASGKVPKAAAAKKTDREPRRQGGGEEGAGQDDRGQDDRGQDDRGEGDRDQEGGSGQEDGHDRREEDDRGRTTAAAKKAPAKKAPARKAR